MICLGAVVLGATASTAVASASADNVTEAGSSLIYPLAQTWASNYTTATVQTSAGGSSVGISDISHSAVSIGASDAPMTSTQFSQDTAGTPVQIPWALSATGLGYNIPGVSAGLKLTPAVIADIYTGKITNWNNAAITKINPKFAAALKKAGTIAPIFRSDGSGDSYAVQHFLTAAEPSIWKLGYSTAWGGTVGTGENGNAGVAGEVTKVKGSIGYMAAYYLLQNHLNAAAVENAAGEYEVPNPGNIVAAASSNPVVSAQGPTFTGVSIVWPAKKYTTAYPISTYTYAIVNKNEPGVSDVQAFLNWAISTGQTEGAKLDFVPLPTAISNADTTLINSL